MRENARLEFDRNLGSGNNSTTDTVLREVEELCEGKADIC